MFVGRDSVVCVMDAAQLQTVVFGRNAMASVDCTGAGTNTARWTMDKYPDFLTVVDGVDIEVRDNRV